MGSLLAGTDVGLVTLDTDATRVTGLDGRSVEALAEDDTGGWWAVVDGTQLWAADPGPGRWTRRAISNGPGLTCLLPGDGGVLVGTAGAHLARLVGDDLEPIEAFEETEGRQEWYTPWGGPPDTRWLAGDDDDLYANVHVGGILRSTDGGSSWRPTIDLHADVHQVLAGAAPGLVLAPCAEGLAASDDHGATWQIDQAGLAAHYCRAVATTATTVVVSASAGPDGRRSGLYHRPLTAAGPFRRCSRGLPEWFDGNVDTGCLVARGSTVAAATRRGGVFRSDDEGASWRRAGTPAAPVRCLALTGGSDGP